MVFFQIFLAILYLTIVYFITGQPLEWHRSSMFFCTCFVCAFIAESIGHNVASVFNAVVRSRLRVWHEREERAFLRSMNNLYALFQNSIFFGPALSCALMLVAVQDFGDPSPRSLYQLIPMYMSYIRYGLEALITAMYGYGRARLPCPVEEVYCHFSSPKEILRTIGRNLLTPTSRIISPVYICVSSYYTHRPCIPH